MEKYENSIVKMMEKKLSMFEKEKGITQIYLYIEGIDDGLTHVIHLAVPASDKFVEKYRRGR